MVGGGANGRAGADAREISRASRARKERLFVAVCIVGASMSVLVLAALLGAILYQGASHLSWEFLNSYASRRPSQAGIKAALWGTIWLLFVCAAIALPLGVGAAIFMEEYAPRKRWQRKVHSFIQLNITNLAGVPSIVYGIIGLTVFARMFGAFGSPNPAMYDAMDRVALSGGRVVIGDPAVSPGEGRSAVRSPVDGLVEFSDSEVRSKRTIYVREHTFELTDGRTVVGTMHWQEDGSISLDNRAQDSETTFRPEDIRAWRRDTMTQFGSEDSPFFFRLPFGSSVLTGGLTLMLVILPIVIISTREALRAVPPSLREGALALGSTKWQMVSRMILPASVPGIMTGAILAMSRAIGEAAPLLVISGIVFIMFTPKNLMSDFTAMPLQIFNWAGRPQAGFQNVAAAGIIVLLVVLLAFNAVAILIRQKFQKPLQ